MVWDPPGATVKGPNDCVPVIVTPVKETGESGAFLITMAPHVTPGVLQVVGGVGAEGGVGAATLTVQVWSTLACDRNDSSSRCPSEIEAFKVNVPG